ncbi:PAS domain-containing sensor histidine kinase [Desulfurispira natronophila]|uniref:histidine kinase n=1 Tax=Desulfurispira natronophila TaxID=682562 RepID=A0A7W7Y316_9BACT|nr:sensor histidine kinase [Desulfurispira natronophila]MBB5021171.1 PAS domain S-box-containing protein [Desulfurispira natronophila]
MRNSAKISIITLLATLIATLSSATILHGLTSLETHHPIHTLAMVTLVLATIATALGLITLWLCWPRTTNSEQPVTRHEQCWKTALEASGDGTWQWDITHNQITCSNSWKSLHGIPLQEEIDLQRHFLQRLHPDDAPRVQQIMQECLAVHSTQFEEEMRLFHPQKQNYIWILVRGWVVERDSHGQAMTIIGVNTDLTKRKTIEEELRKAKVNLAEAQRVAQMGSWEWDLRSDQVTLSDELSHLLGGAHNEDSDTVAASIYDPRYWHPADWPRLQEAVAGAIADGEEYDLDLRLNLPDHGHPYVFVRIRPVLDEGGQIIKLLGIIMDITSRKQMEEALKELNQNLEQRIEQEIEERTRHQELFIQQAKMAAMGDMIGVIAHQWSQPLNAIGLQAQFMMFDYESHDKSYFEEACATIQQQVEFMTQTLGVFRDFFKPTRQKTRFHVGTSIETVLELFGVQFTKHNIHIFLHPPRLDHPGFEVVGLPNEFKQVILNILLNARDAILERIKNQGPDEEHRIEVQMSIEQQWVNIAITDTGGGVPKAIVGQIFDHYFSTKGDQGTGIGLYISRIIVEQNMGGRITVENTEQGARFTINLPQSTQQHNHDA